MKQILFTFIALALLALNPLSGQNLTFSPEHPTPGEEVMIKYDPAGTPLEGMSEIEVTAFFFEDGLPTSHEVEMSFNENHFQGSIQTSGDTKIMYLSLTTEDGKTDDNGEKGYGVKMYNVDGKPVAGARANKAMAVGSYSRYVNVKRDYEKAFKYMKKEFTAFPDSKNNETYLRWYATLAKNNKDEAAMADVKNIAETFFTKRKATEEDLTLAYTLSRTLGDEEKTEVIAKKVRKKYPKGKLVSWDLRDEFYKEKDFEKKLALYEKFAKNYGNEEEYKGTMSSFARSLASLYAREKDWDNYQKYIAKTDNPVSKAGSFNNIAWNECGEGIEKEPGDLDFAQKLSEHSLELLEREMNNPQQKPGTLTPKQWKKNLKRSYGLYADTYAVILYRQGKYEEALRHQTIACEADGYHDGDMNKRYCVYLEKTEGPESAEKALEKMIAEGNANNKMKEHYKQLFLANNSLEDAFEKYMASLEEKALELMREDLKKEMIDEPAPDFALVNLKGETVSLADMRGKVVVVDFWATWCGPCKASFPGMQRVVNQYSDNPNVELLFINTWERVENKAEVARDFITKNEYTFHVLLDEKNEVVPKFGVEGIPTKFVIDPNGHIRFRSVGYGGNDEELVQELTLMIEMAGEASKSKLMGAP